MMNPTANGGPVGGGTMMMMGGNGSPAVMANHSNGLEESKLFLNTYIYEYFLKMGHHKLARACNSDPEFNIKKQDHKNGDMNGDIDPEYDNLPQDLPRPKLPKGGSNGFLIEWYSIFTDLFFSNHADKKQMGPGNNVNPAQQYLLQTQYMNRMHEMRQNPSVNRQVMANQAMAQQMRNGMPGGKQMQPTPAQMAQMAARNPRNAAPRAMMAGDLPNGDTNGMRPDTPADGEGIGSPNKRPRLDGGQQQLPEGMMMINPRAPQMPQNNPNMMLQNGFNPNPQMQRNGITPQKQMNGMMTNGQMDESPLMQPLVQFEGMDMNMYAQSRAANGMPNGGLPNGGGMPNGAAGSTGNHALQDYQMQLMLLEQQNKKRLMMARQEHNDNPNGAAMVAGMGSAGLSPSGSRSGGSPGSGDGMKRSMQGMGMPGSPMTADMQGRSPATMAYMENLQSANFNPMFMADKQMMTQNQQLRGPTAVEMAGMPRQGQQMQFRGGQPMVQQNSQGGPGMSTPVQRTEMPPPQGPLAGQNPQRPQTGSPNNGNQPPTPSQNNKPAPKGKKGEKEANPRKRPTKKNSTAQAPTSDDNTANGPPIIPVMNNNGGNKAQQMNMQNSNAMHTNGLHTNNQPMNNNFDDLNVNLDFTTLESEDTLQNFDFDSFLNTNDNEGISTMEYIEDMSFLAE